MRIFWVLILFISCQLQAYTSAVDDYDPQTGFYFYLAPVDSNKGALSSVSSVGGFNNLFIYDPVTKTGRNLFQHNTNQITALLIPTEFNLQDKKITFLNYSVEIKNNRNLLSTNIPARILVEVYDPKTKNYSVWTSPKKESKPDMMFSYQKPAFWHLDVASWTIRLVSPAATGIKVMEYSLQD